MTKRRGGAKKAATSDASPSAPTEAATANTATKGEKKKTKAKKPKPTSAERAAARKEHLRWLPVCLLSGTLWFTSCASFDIWIFAWFAMVPSLFAIERATTRRRALLYGWFTGFVANAGGFYWIIGLLERFGHLPWPVAAFGFSLLAGYQAVVFLLFAWAAREIRRSTSLPMTLVAPIVMVAFELLVPFIFPWYLAITQAWQIHVIQIADLTGPLGVTALLMMVNGAIYDVITRRRAALVPAGAALAILGGALGYGHVRINQLHSALAAAPHIKVGVVQPNVSFDMKGIENPNFADAQLADLQRRSQELDALGADLILWTESSYPFALPRDLKNDPPLSTRAHIRRGFKAPLVMGAITADPRDPDAYPYNTALMLDAEGHFTAKFDKIFLLMFGEYIPGLETFPWLKKIMPRAAGHFARGKQVASFPFEHAGQTYRLGPMICYEDILPAFGRKLAALHPHLLVNITNDAWFGETSEPWEHLQLAVYRSVELRTDLVRAVNTGVSAYVDATGAVYAKTYAVDPAKHPKGADKAIADVALLEGGHTVYAAVGDLFGYLNAAATLFLWLLLPALRRARSRAT